MCVYIYIYILYIIQLYVASYYVPHKMFMTLPRIYTSRFALMGLSMQPVTSTHIATYTVVPTGISYNNENKHNMNS